MAAVMLHVEMHVAHGYQQGPRQQTIEPVHMVAQLVRKHISLREISSASAEAFQVVPEAQIDVDLLILRAIEGSGRSLRGAAAGVGTAAEEHEFRV